MVNRQSCSVGVFYNHTFDLGCTSRMVRRVLHGGACVLATLFVIGCHANSPAIIRESTSDAAPVDLSNAQRGPAVVADFNRRLARDGAIHFLSFNGRWQGAGNDLELIFQRGVKVRLVQHGTLIQHFDGTYILDPDGSAAVDLDKLGWHWPSMLLMQDGQTLVLTLRLKEKAVNWPFRALPR